MEWLGSDRTEEKGVRGERPRRQRLFFALWPDEDVRAKMARVGKHVPRRRGRPVPSGNLHITLAFVGPVDEDTARCVEAAAERVQVTPFTLRLDELGQFRRAQVLWLGSSETPPPLMRLVQSLSEALAACGYRPDARPFTPHVTLFRKAELGAEALPAIRPIEWPVAGFVLVVSETAPQGVRYRLLRHYPCRDEG